MAENENNSNNLIYGKNSVTSLLKSGRGIDTVLVADTVDKKTLSYYTALAKPAGAIVKQIPAVKLSALCPGVSHQGIAAFTSEVEYASISDIFERAKENGTPPFILLCDGIEDPHNFGALLRSALLCGASGAIIAKRGQSAVTPVVMKASAGAAALLPVARVANLGEAVRTIKRQNVFVYCADMEAPPVHKQNLKGATALVVGNEGRGVSPLIKKLCDGAVSLPMAQNTQNVDSFNVSVAGGIIMYEIFRQNSQTV